MENSALVYASDSFRFELVLLNILYSFEGFFSFSSFLLKHLRLEEVERHLWRSSPTRKDYPGLLPICLLVPPQIKLQLFGESLGVFVLSYSKMVLGCVQREFLGFTLHPFPHLSLSLSRLRSHSLMFIPMFIPMQNVIFVALF